MSTAQDLQEQVNLLRGALRHIERTAANSRTSTRRLRWIELRAKDAIDGNPYSQSNMDLPKSGGINASIKLSEKLTTERRKVGTLRAALSELVENVEPPPNRNCSCHISPPCGDCVNWGGLRFAIDAAAAALIDAKQSPNL